MITTAPGTSLRDVVSVVIPVRDDHLLFRCLKSMDELVQVVVVTNGSSAAFRQAVDLVASDDVRAIHLDNAGIGGAYNAGIAAATGSHILLMDSDCVFVPGTIRALSEGANLSDLVKGRVVFQSSSWQTKLTARAREHLEDPLRTGKVNAYSPPLLYRKSIGGELGGYHFDARLQWREDRDFELRRRRAKLPVTFIESAVIIHKPLTIREDLRSVRHYGRAQRVGEQLQIFPRTQASHELAKLGRLSRRIWLQSRDVILAFYPVLRRLAFQVGYHDTFFRAVSPPKTSSSQ